VAEKGVKGITERFRRVQRSNWTEEEEGGWQEEAEGCSNRCSSHHLQNNGGPTMLCLMAFPVTQNDITEVLVMDGCRGGGHRISTEDPG
jgi:hypothetical protein